MEQFIEQQYMIRVIDSFLLNDYRAFRDPNCIYVMIPVSEGEQEEIIERYELSNELRNAFERYVPEFVKNREGLYISQWGEHYFLLLKIDVWRTQEFQRLGKRLAKFHYRGMNAIQNVKKLNRMGQWKTLWESRVDALEIVWQETVMNRPNTEFEKLFIDSFPYYAGLTENAIQYLVDTQLDEKPGISDFGTICHEHFTRETWSGDIIWKNPFEWVVDHPARDLAEWTRDTYLENPYTYQNQLQQFFQQYQSVIPLSGFSLRFFYSRLIFPRHYLQSVEDYFVNKDEQTRRALTRELRGFVEKSDEYERFLASVYDIIQVPVRKMSIPQLDWLVK